MKKSFIYLAYTPRRLVPDHHGWKQAGMVLKQQPWALRPDRQRETLSLVQAGVHLLQQDHTSLILPNSTHRSSESWGLRELNPVLRPQCWGNCAKHQEAQAPQGSSGSVKGKGFKDEERAVTELLRLQQPTVSRPPAGPTCTSPRRSSCSCIWFLVTVTSYSNLSYSLQARSSS